MARVFVQTSSQYLELAQAVISSLPITISAWVKTNNPSSVDDQAIVFLGDKDVSGVHYVLRYDSTSGSYDLLARARDGTFTGDATVGNGTGLNDGNWHHAAGVFATTTSRKAYLDGTGGSTNTTSVGAPAAWDVTAIGGMRDSTPDSYFDGSVGEIAIWNVELSAGEIQMLAKRFPAYLIRPQNLVAYVPAVRDDRDIVEARIFTAYGSPTFGEHPPIIWQRPIATFKTTASAPIEESVTLNRVLRCAQPTGTNETASANRILTVTASETLTGVGADSENRILAVTAAEIVDIGNGLTANRILGIQIQAGQIVEETVTVAKFLAMSATEEAQAGGSVTLGRVMGIAPTQYATIGESVSVGRQLTSAPASLAEIADAITLDRLIQIFANGGAGTVEEAVALAKYLGIAGSSLVTIDAGVGLAISEGVSVIERLAKFDESVTIAKYVAIATSDETGPIEESVILSQAFGIGANAQLVATGTVSLARFLAANTGSLVEVNGTLVLIRSDGVYPLSQTEVGEAISIDRYVAALASVGHKVVPVRFISAMSREDTFTSETRRVIIVPPRRDINVD